MKAIKSFIRFRGMNNQLLTKKVLGMRGKQCQFNDIFHQELPDMHTYNIF